MLRFVQLTLVASSVFTAKAETPAHGKLLPLQFLVGEWSADYELPAATPEIGAKKGSKASQHLSCVWILDGAAIELKIETVILSDVSESASGYGVTIRRADVKDLIFPGNLQEIMNRVLAAERHSQAQLVEARTQAEVEQIEAKSRAETTRLDAEAEAEARRLREQAESEATAAKVTAETRAYEERAKAAEVLEGHPALLRLAELETLRELAQNANARLYLRLDRVSLNGTDSGKHDS